MRYKTIQIDKVTPTIGAEIRGVDLGMLVSNEQVTEICHALFENLVLIFREQQVAFARRFGPLHIYHGLQSASLPGVPEVMELKADETSAMVFGEPWHQDATADEEPPLATMLYMHQIPENGGGDTCFSSGYAAYEALSEPVKELLQGLHAVHELGFGNTAYFTKRQQLDSPELPTHVSVRPQYAVHPVVHTHPTTARKTLFVNKIFTRHVIGVSPLESRRYWRCFSADRTRPI